MVKFTVSKTKRNDVARLLYDRDLRELLSMVGNVDSTAILNDTTYETIYSFVKCSWEAHNDEGYLSHDVSRLLENENDLQRAAAVIRLSEYLCAIRSIKNYGRGRHRIVVRDGIFDCMFLLEFFQLKLVGRQAGEFLAAVSSIRLGRDSYYAWLKKRASESSDARIKGIEHVIRSGGENVSTSSWERRNAKQLTLFDIIHVAFESPSSRL